MKADVFVGQWKQMRGDLKSWWGKLTDDDLDRIGGQKDKLIGLVQETYGYAHAQPSKRSSGASGSLMTRWAGPSRQ